jgi:hypothetical protein
MPKISRMQIFDLLARKSLIYERLNVNSDWIDLDFMERERTPQQAMKLGIQMHVAGLSLSNTTSVLEELGVERSRKAVHDWVSLESAPNGRIRDDRVNAARSRDTKQIYSLMTVEVRITLR